MKTRLLKLKIWFFIWLLKNKHGYDKVSTKLLFAQTWHETGDFKSEVFKDNNNLFGMRHPSIRPTRSQGSRHAHAIFKNHYDSVYDYFLRQKNFNIPNVEDSSYIINTVASGYAEDPAYSTKWLNVKNTIKKPFTTWFFVGLLFFCIVVTYLIMKLLKK